MDRRGGRATRSPQEPKIRAAFARVLVELREQADLTQEEVGEKSGYEEKYISALERRKHTPTLTAIIQLATALDVSPMEILRRVLELLPKFSHLEVKS